MRKFTDHPKDIKAFSVRSLAERTVAYQDGSGKIG